MSAERYTRSDCERLAALVAERARALGIVAESTTVQLEAGSTTYGRAWRLVTIHAGESGHRDGFGLGGGGGYLGRTAREAWRTLSGMLAALAACDNVREHGRP